MKNMMPIQRKLKLQQSILSTHYTTKQKIITYLELHILTIHFTAFFTPEKNKKETKRGKTLQADEPEDKDTGSNLKKLKQ